MHYKIFDHIVKSKSKVFIMIDESTSIANVLSLIIHVRLLYDNAECIYFLGLVPLPSPATVAIFDELTCFLNDSGLMEDILDAQLAGCAMMKLVT